MPARLLHVATVGLLAISTVLGMKRPISRTHRRVPRKRPHLPEDEDSPFPPIYVKSKIGGEPIPYIFDKDGVPRWKDHPLDTYAVLKHPLRDEMKEAFTEWCKYLKGKMLRFAQTSPRYQKWRDLCDAEDDDREPDIMLWKLEANYHRLKKVTDWKTVVAAMEKADWKDPDGDALVALYEVCREELGYRRGRGPRRRFVEIMLNANDYLDRFLIDTERNKVKRSGKYKRMTTREAAFYGYDYFNTGGTKVRFAKAIEDEVPNHNYEDDKMIETLKQAAVTAWRNKKIAAPRSSEETSSSSSEATSSSSEATPQKPSLKEKFFEIMGPVIVGGAGILAAKNALGLRR